MSGHPLDAWLRRGDRRAGAFALLAAGAGVLGAGWALQSWLAARAELVAVEREAAAAARAELELELAERGALRDLVAEDLARAKENATSLTRSRRALFEGGLRVSEETRLLQKQWEIMSTWLRLDADADRVTVMKGDQAASDWPLEGARPRAVGGELKPLPARATIVSKERYAHPERPKSDATGGLLDWEPPQVGASARANALGESVMFTREGLVVHGPPKKEAEHEAYPHLCLTVPTATARRLYAAAFIGTRIILRPEEKP
ncbi:MAG: hypothetical protein SF051_07910 [Elusimicrobiota bacterium]|nr:hypothetical protein [Elusimicrobiota bacterium]